MTPESGFDRAPLAHHESLSLEQIHRLVRAAAPGISRTTDNRTSKLGMFAMCFVCLVVGASARDLTHWALGDFATGPYGLPGTWPVTRFRCGGFGWDPLRDGASDDSADIGRVGSAATDELRDLPEPAAW